MRTRPLFEIGEEVILVSLDKPEYCGEYRVIDRIWYDYANNKGRVFATWAYRLDGRANGIPWGECSLRKKPKPGKDFDELIKDLKQPTGETA